MSYVLYAVYKYIGQTELYSKHIYIYAFCNRSTLLLRENIASTVLLKWKNYIVWYAVLISHFGSP